jgi:1,5-anhydro-D-fructose reductase (1,5-anhydro-D-mannitol-forming)
MAIRWGILGCGDVCEVKSGPAFQKAGGSALVAVMRRDPHKAADYAKRHGVARWYADADALIGDPDVDAVYVATPPGSHAELALRVAAAGKPCYVEKPMARNHAECLRMVEAFRAAGRPLFVAYYRRRLPRFVKAKELIDAGRLGRVTGVVYRHTRLFRPTQPDAWRLDPAQSGGGLFLDLGSHALDLFDFLLGPLADVAGAAERFSEGRAEDAVAMSFRTGSGALGIASWNFAAATRTDLIEIDGTHARLVVSCFGNEPLRLELPGGQVETFDLPNPPHIQQPFIQSMVDELNPVPGAAPAPSTGETAARTSKVMDDVLAAYYGSRADGFWERGS